MRRMKWLLLAFLFQPLALASTKYRIGVENISYLPYYQSEHNQWSGFARDFLDGFAKSEGIEFEYVPVPINRLYDKFLDPSSDLDFKFPDNEHWAGDKKKGKAVLYTDALVDFTDGTLVSPSRLGKPKSELKTLGTVRGFTPWDYLADINETKSIKLVENDVLKGLIEQAKTGRVQGIYANVAVVRYTLEQVMREPGALVFDPALPHTQGTYKLSTIKHEALLKKVNAYIATHQGERKALEKKWGL